jgi:hypothetical protein
MSVGECVYCGEQRELTSDHVPPKCLFSKPRPALITVPSCEPCNRAYGKEDEYFRIAITTGIDRDKFPKENAGSVKAITNLARRESLGFAHFFLEGWDRQSGSMTFKRERIEIVISRIARGLFFHHKAVRIPLTVGFACCEITESTKTHAEGRERINRLGENLTAIGQGVFRYAFEPFEPPDPFGTVWLMRFYDLRTFFCVTASSLD